MKMTYEFKFDKPNQVFLLEVNERVKNSIKNSEYAQKRHETLRIDKESLEKFHPVKNPDSYIFAQNLIAKIEYILSKIDLDE
ncbi:hypothetical protein [Methanobacterium petrolearium]|uniref:hypothetical protein n=1 Tax=Methanobacterium petrolearium TaxID=710190 RepID=UPI001AE974AF|nr:hypothetical protein [Methanobacterium petrolearium]MBP1945747.1 hypothetical protein [Methanobacterium petrolearium]BDZ71996.1 hypothetical protein GCM10025861_25130 [Methanobacterium petrolearium]